LPESEWAGTSDTSCTPVCLQRYERANIEGWLSGSLLKFVYGHYKTCNIYGITVIITALQSITRYYMILQDITRYYTILQGLKGIIRYCTGIARYYRIFHGITHGITKES